MPQGRPCAEAAASPAAVTAPQQPGLAKRASSSRGSYDRPFLLRASADIRLAPVRNQLGDLAHRVILGVGLAALARVRAVLEHGHLAPGRGDPAQKTGDHGIRNSTTCAWGFAASTADFVSLIFAMLTPRKPRFPGASGSQADGSRVKFRQAPADV